MWEARWLTLIKHPKYIFVYFSAFVLLQIFEIVDQAYRRNHFKKTRLQLYLLGRVERTLIEIHIN